MDVVISSVLDLKKNIKPCREVKIFRDKIIIQYNHHMLVTRADEHKCEMIHYSFTKATDYLKCKYPVAISRFKLVYDEYDTAYDVKKIFNFNDGDMLIIVHRTDYPNTAADIECVISRAELRLGEQMYSAYSNNCEAFLNWVFTGENFSKQIQHGGRLNIAAADTVDTILTNGAEKPYAKMVESGIVQATRTVNNPQKIGTDRITMETSEKIIEAMVLKEAPKQTQKIITASSKMSITTNVAHDTVSGAITKKTTSTFARKVTQSTTEIGKNTSKTLTKSVSVKSVSQTVTKQTAGTTKGFARSTTNLAEEAADIISKKVTMKTSSTLTKHTSTSVVKNIEKGTSEIRKNVAKVVSEKASVKSGEATITASSVKLSTKASIVNNMEKGTTEIRKNVAKVVSEKASVKSGEATITSSSVKLSTKTSKTIITQADDVATKITTSGVAIAFVFEAAILSKRIYDICQDKTKEHGERKRKIVKEVGTSIGSLPASIIGGAVGQALIPIPVVGGMLGGLFGSLVGGAIGGAVSGATYDVVTSTKEVTRKME